MIEELFLYEINIQGYGMPLFCIVAIFLQVISLILFFTSEPYSPWSDNSRREASMLFFGGAVVVFFVGALFLENLEQQMEQEAIQQGYIIYINGVEVEANTINIEEYDNVKIDDENGYIIITTGEGK